MTGRRAIADRRGEAGLRTSLETGLETSLETGLEARLAVSLALVAGHVNIVAVLVCGIVASHMTGHAGALGRDLVEARFGEAALLAALVTAFAAGAFVAGLAVEFGRARGWRSLYALPSAIELALLVAFATGVELHDPSALETGAGRWWMGVAAALAMGVQNAMVTRISSGVVRTTHLTGVLTDLGHESARLAVVRRLFGAGRASGSTDLVVDGGVGPRRLLLLASILGAFMAGSALGAVAFAAFPRWSMLPPVALLLWIVVHDLGVPIAPRRVA
jgi:uncharacterized membrane protein YoaK (UPF0700 family)